MSLTIKQAFEALSDACANGMKNPFFVMRRLKESFADVASKVEGSGDKVTVTPITDSGTKIAEIKVNNTTSNLYAPDSSVIYSTTERKIGKWVDNSDLYQKTVFIEHLPDGTISDDWVYYNTGIDGTINVIEMTGTILFANGNKSPIPYVLANGLQGAFLNQIGLFFKTETTQIGIMCGSDRSSAGAYVTIRYTKVSS